jgi:hypothetical protein
VTGTAWEHQREVRDALRAIVPDPRLGIGALSSTASSLAADRGALAQAPMHPPTGPGPGPLDDSIL